MYLSTIKTALRRDDVDLEAWAETLHPLAPPAAVASPPPPPAAPAAPPVGSASAPGREERWVRVTLVAGLDLMLKAGAGELAIRLASEIRQRYFGA